VEYWTPKAQDEWLKKCFPNKIDLIKDLLIPENDMRRRNFGYLRAIELDSDLVITVDDDNFPLKGESWLNGHIKSLTNPLRKLGSPIGVINPCNFLKLSYYDVYSRGYPLSKYYLNDLVYFQQGKSKSILNMGLWKNKPDVDSFTNILYPDLNSERLYGRSSYCLAKNNYFPVNTQNTSFKKELSFFHNLFMHPALFHRFDDIWIGLFTQRLMHKMGDSASFGKPLVDHRRNIHSYIRDFNVEFMGIILNDRMWNFIMDMPIESKTYNEGFLEIASHLPKFFDDYWFSNFFNKMKDSMELWVELIES